MAWPDFFVIGAPKAGTTASHDALARHPELFLPAVKEPKFFLCAQRPPPRSGQRGPGDAHSAREWMWRPDQYRALFDVAPPGRLRGESTPFYLSDFQAQARIRRAVPHARLIVVLRDPVDRPTPTGCICGRTA
jgi:Sulfotransferase family